MILLKEILGELFKKGYEYNDTGNDSYNFETPDGDRYVVEFFKDSVRERSMYERVLKVEMGISGDAAVVEVIFSKKVKRKWDNDSGGGNAYDWDTVEIDRTGNKFYGVLSTVINIISNEVRNNEIIVFSAREASRKRLYDRMVSRLKRVNDIVKTEQGIMDKHYYLIPRSLSSSSSAATKI